MTQRDTTVTPETGAVSRREFFFGAGAAAGAFAAVGSIAGVAHAPAAMAAASRKYYSYYVALELDGKAAGLVLSAEGGEPVLKPGDARTGIGPSVSYEPISLRLADMAPAVYDWIDKASKNLASPRALSLVAAAQDLKESYRLDVQNARLTDITLDPLSAGTKGDLLRFNLKITPGFSQHRYGSSLAIKTTATKQQQLFSGNFKLYIQGLEQTTVRARSVDAVGYRAREDGMLVPLPLKFELALQDAAPVYQWMNDTLSGKSPDRAGELQLLTPTLDKVAASFTFDRLTITRASYPVPSGPDGLQLVQVECEPVGGTRLNPGILLT